MRLLDWLRLLVHAQNDCPKHVMGVDASQVDWANSQGTPQEWAEIEAIWEQAQGHHQEGCAKMPDNIIQGLTGLAGRVHGSQKTTYVVIHQEEGQWLCDVRSTVPLKPATEKVQAVEWQVRGMGATPEVAVAQAMQKLMTQVKQRSQEDAAAIGVADKGYSTISEIARATASKAV